MIIQIPLAGRLSSGDLQPRLGTAPSVASSTGDSSHHGSVRHDSGALRLAPDVAQVLTFPGSGIVGPRCSWQ